MTFQFGALGPKTSPSPIFRVVARTGRVGSGQPIFADINDFLVDEAQLLDERRTEDWLKRLTPDIFYWMPIRRTSSRRDPYAFDPEMAYFYENHASLQMRIGRAVHETAYSEDPPSRTRRMISTVIVHATDRADEWTVDSSIVILRERLDELNWEQLSARREDIIRRSDDGLMLAQRTILVDQTVLRTPNLGIYL